MTRKEGKTDKHYSEENQLLPKIRQKNKHINKEKPEKGRVVQD